MINNGLPGNCEIIKLKTFSDHRGNLTVLESLESLPYDLKRVYWMYGIPDGKTRGGHAHKENAQFILPIHGGFTITIDDGKRSVDIRFENPDTGILVKPMTWSHLHSFLPDTVVGVFASMHFTPEGYMSNYSEYLEELCIQNKNRNEY